MHETPEPPAGSIHPHGDTSGIGVVAVASEPLKLSAISLIPWEYSFPAGARFVGTRIKLGRDYLKGSAALKLVGREANGRSGVEFVIGDVEWESGTIIDYYGSLIPVRSVTPAQVFEHGYMFCAESEDVLFSMSKDKDWVVRYNAFRELIRRRQANRRLRAALDHWNSEPVYMVSTLMNIGRYELFPDVRPPFDR